MSRVIGHLDLDYFYAQVEEVQNPSLRARPVLVCVFSGRTEESGVVGTANYIAREFGVRSGMPIATAKKKLEGKDPAIIRMDHRKYEAVSERILHILRGQVELVEQTGIDEAFFDLTKQASGDFTEAEIIAHRIKNSILRQEGLMCSIGLGESKAVAKIASDSAKPGGLLVVPTSSTIRYLSPLPVARLSGVGPKTGTVLENLGIKTLADLAGSKPSAIEGRLGKKIANYLILASKGLDDSPVTPRQESIQMSRIVTLKQDTRDAEEVMRQLDAAIGDLQGRLVREKISFRSLAATAILTDLTVRTKSRTSDLPINDLTLMKQFALELFRALAHSTDLDFRRAGLRLSGLSKDDNQKSLSDFGMA